MCIINDKAYVSNTRIFVSPDKTYKRQLTIYENKVQTNVNGNAMILPVPGGNIKLHDLSKMPNIMDDIASVFETPMTKSSYDGASTNSIPVVECGSYLVSIVPTVYDFHRINSEVFVVSPNVHDILKNYYDQCSFLVCLLKTGKQHEYHPIAYSHTILKEKLFVPTRHHHGFSTNEEATSFFDHEIYSACASAHPSERWLRIIPESLSHIPDFEMPIHIPVMTKSIIKGEYANTDFWYPIAMPQQHHNDDNADSSCVLC